MANELQINDALAEITELFETEPKEALEKLQNILDDEDQDIATQILVHQQRMQLLLDSKMSQKPTLIGMLPLQQSWLWLKQQDPASAEKIKPVITDRINQIVDELSPAVMEAQPKSLKFNAIESLTLFTEDWPIAALPQGLLLLRLYLIKEEESSDQYLSLRRNIDLFKLDCAREKHKTSLTLEGNTPKATELLQSVIQTLPESHHLYQLTVEALLRASVLAGDVVTALTTMTSYQRFYVPPPDEVDEFQQYLFQKGLATYDTYLKQAFSNAQSSKITALLPTTADFTHHAPIQQWLGDVALYQERFSDAAAHYENAHNLLDVNEPVLAYSLCDNQALFTMLKNLHDSGLFKPVKNNGQPPEQDCESGDLALIYSVDESDKLTRATVGFIIALYRAQRYAEICDRLEQLLATPNLPEKVTAMVFSSLEAHDRQQLIADCEALREQILNLWPTGQWAEIVQTLQQLTSNAMSQQSDRVLLAFAMLMNGDSPAAIAHVLQNISAQDWGVLTEAEQRRLLQCLVDNGDFVLVDGLRELIQADEEWSRLYTEQRSGYIQNKLQATTQQMALEKLESALALIHDVQKLEPGHLQARFLEAQIQMRLGELAVARQLLQELLTCPDKQIGFDAHLSLVEIDLAENRLTDAQHRLEQLTGEPTDSAQQVKKNLQNRLDGRPHIQIEAIQSTIYEDSLQRHDVTDSWAAWFAVRVGQAVSVNKTIPMFRECARLLSVMGLTNHAGVTTQFSWRYVTAGQKLTIALLCRVEAGSEQIVHTEALELWGIIKEVLPVQNALIWEPVYDIETLNWLRLPGPVQGVVEIARQEAAAIHTTSGGYNVLPFGVRSGDLLDMLNLMLQQPGTTALSLNFQPTQVLPWEQDAAKNLFQGTKTKSENTNGDEQPINGTTELADLFASDLLDIESNRAKSRYSEFLHQARQPVFLTQFHLTTHTGPISNTLAKLVAVNLLGASARYDLHFALHEDDLSHIQRCMQDVTIEPWSYSAAPKEMRRWRYLLTIQELLNVTRLPTPDMNGLPGLPYIKGEFIEVPKALHRAVGSGVMLGESLLPFDGLPLPIHMQNSIRPLHTYLIGRTGTGKSTLMANMILQDIYDGQGVGVIDPHGDLIQDVLSRIPRHRMRDVVLFDPTDFDFPVALNILDVADEFEANAVVSDFIDTLSEIYDPHAQGITGPRFESNVRNIMLSLIDALDNPTLVDVVHAITDSEYRKKLATQVKSPILKSYWENIGKDIDKFGWGQSNSADNKDWLASKFNRFVDNYIIRNIIGQRENSIDYMEVMDTGKILLVDLSKGKLGASTGAFIGRMVVSRFLMIAHRRALMPKNQRRLFYLYVDEFQNFVNTRDDSFSEMLSEVRKYGLAMIIAHQYQGQLNTEVRDAIMGNVGTLLSFRVGIKDAYVLGPEFYPATADTIVNLPNYQVLAKMTMNGDILPPVVFHTLPLTYASDPAVAEMTRRYSRQKYGRARYIVEHEITELYRATENQDDKKSKRTLPF